jgi:hypothetical protein
MDSQTTIRNLQKELDEMLKMMGWMEKSGTIHQLDLDILLDKTRKLYSQILDIFPGPLTHPAEPVQIQAVPPTPDKSIKESIPEKRTSSSNPEPEEEQGMTEAEEPADREETATEADPIDIQATLAQPPVEEPETVQKRPEAQPEPAREQKPAASPEPVRQPEPARQAAIFPQPAPPQQQKPVASPSREKVSIADQPSQNRDNGSLNEVFGKHKSGHATTATLNETPVSDIWSAITINERFLFIRELFTNDPERFKNTVGMLNSLDSWEAARQIISERFDWGPDNEVATEFLSIVRRRFMK